MKYWASGKLLITAEYSILRGSTGLSLPTKFGQHLETETTESDLLHWKSKDEFGNVWFEASIEKDFNCVQSSDLLASNNLIKILRTASNLNPGFNPFGINATTTLDFNPDWGLGSSSTLVALIAKWANVDAMQLFFKTSTGSGYDVATAMANHPILYTLKEGKAEIQSATFNPPFKHSLFFLYLGKKQRSHREVLAFEKRRVSKPDLEKISRLTQQIVDCKELSLFEELITEHEAITAAMVGQQTIKSQLFSDYGNAIKSLGAWGGDFVLLACPSGDLNYFKTKGFHTILSWSEMFAV